MDILFLTHRFYPYYGGAEKYFLQISEKEVKKGNNVKVYTSDVKDINYFFSRNYEKYEKRYLNENGIEIYRIPIRHFKYNRRLALYFSKMSFLRDFFGSSYVFYPQFPINVIKDRKKYDIIYAGPLPFTYLFKTAILKKKFGKVKKIIGIPLMHPPVPYDKTRENEYLSSLHLLNQMDEIVALSEAEKEYLKSIGVKTTIKVIPPEVNIPVKIEPYKTDKDYFLQISYLDERKGVLDFLRAMEYFWRKKENIKVILVGRISPDIKDILLNYINKYSEYIEHYEYVTEEQKYAFIKGSKGLVMISRAESYGYVYKEAIELNIPAFAAYYGFIPDIWKDELRYVPFGHPFLLFNRLKEIL